AVLAPFSGVAPLARLLPRQGRARSARRSPARRSLARLSAARWSLGSVREERRHTLACTADTFELALDRQRCARSCSSEALHPARADPHCRRFSDGTGAGPAE